MPGVTWPPESSFWFYSDHGIGLSAAKMCHSSARKGMRLPTLIFVIHQRIPFRDAQRVVAQHYWRHVQSVGEVLEGHISIWIDENNDPFSPTVQELINFNEGKSGHRKATKT